MRNNASQVYNSLPVRYNQGEGRRGVTRLTQPKSHNMMTRRPIRHGNSAVGREEEERKKEADDLNPVASWGKRGRDHRGG